ncbi:acylneuraminate cytidylyltransferase family protein [Candidatus Pelagibacter bacterium]|jgi:CMP-N,N'-diacetyllegionaminic acid synthase|nr:acylneuraminate cytidylyltransferase family protein [Candidatus Pelagibacter sp.]MDB2446706.1 acylneuraminate cytidylyltransferase family protein [Candidatus Pelagibacter bacterium]
MKILGFIPARGGSKTIPLKNLHKIFNKPLIQYTIESALQSKIFYKIIVSSDHKKILNFTKKFKKISSLKRPKNISGDAASTDSALEHTLNQLAKNKDIKPEYICIIEPTAPLRSALSLKKLKNFLKKKEVNSLITINSLDHIPGKIKNDKFHFLEFNRQARQLRKKYYIETGTFYLVSYKYFMKYKKIVSKKPYGFEVPKIESIDINDHEDLKFAEGLLKLKK